MHTLLEVPNIFLFNEDHGIHECFKEVKECLRAGSVKVLDVCAYLNCLSVRSFIKLIEAEFIKVAYTSSRTRLDFITLSLRNSFRHKVKYLLNKPSVKLKEHDFQVLLEE